MKTADIKKKIDGTEHQQKMKIGVKEGIKAAGYKNKEAFDKLNEQKVIEEAMAEKFVNFLESIKESDPTLVESLQEAFVTCFMESDEAIEPTTSLFDKHGWFNGSIPEEAVEECTRGGQDAIEPVKKWVVQLGFKVPRDLAIKYLKEFGAWDDLESESDDELANKVFWIACSDINEQGDWQGLVH